MLKWVGKEGSGERKGEKTLTNPFVLHAGALTQF